MKFSKTAFYIFLIAGGVFCVEMLALYLLFQHQIISMAASNALAILAIISATIASLSLIFGILFPLMARTMLSRVLAKDQMLYLLQFKIWRLILDEDDTKK